ncbi:MULTISPECIES: 3-phosphoshikimate 1-carboxyvinyltransferase [Hyphobacterium]|uniref:3-phosphoshikimate 1-carboxyvinyltransferase n=1 Tax=Hyphobacterium vulgare TaxID=1736751 RepID=A0ABV6ZXM1_9PROT
MSGCIAAPGDKSVSHRALIMAALAAGESRITGLLESEDVLATARAVAALGAGVHRDAEGWRVVGTGGQFRSPDRALDLGNSGTGVRLLMGAVAGTGATADFTGDASLSSRPMARVLDPLTAMGAGCTSTGGRLPARISGGCLNPVDWSPEIASAQVKSAILLAALGAAGETVVREPAPTRDHTERMLPLFGGRVEADGSIVRLTGPQALTGTRIEVPGDPSSAAFALVAGLIMPGSAVTLTGVIANPARDGIYRVLERMGAKLARTPGAVMAGEDTVDLAVESSALRAVDLEAAIAPSMIDEYPILAVAAAFAEGESRFRGLAELRAKESDRLAGTAALLAANGVTVRIEGDDLIVSGMGPAGAPGGGTVITRGDHRLAMAGLVLGCAAKSPVRIDDAAMIATSYPGFLDDMRKLGARMGTA